MARRDASIRAFTIIELLVVVSIIALLIGILLPAISKARDQAKLSMSQANLRNLATAHANYEAEWGDRQLTIIDDQISYRPARRPISCGVRATGLRDWNWPWSCPRGFPPPSAR